MMDKEPMQKPLCFFQHTDGDLFITWHWQSRLDCYKTGWHRVTYKKYQSEFKRLSYKKKKESQR